VIPLALDEIAELCSGRLDRAPAATTVTGLEIDSRRIRPGDLFVAIRGGIDHVQAALDAGAAAALVPDDPHLAMAALGRAVRERSDARVVAVTGATGKTSTKDILAALCRPHLRTVAAEQSHNNEIGLPLTLTRIEPDTQLVIAEMGTRGAGQIGELCAIARPEVAIVTAIGPAHLELFGSIEAIAAAEAETIAALPAGGVAILPSQEPLLEPHLTRRDVEVVTYGDGGDVRLLLFETGERSRLEVSVLGERLSLHVDFRARHNATNALAALAAYAALGLPLDDVQRGADRIVLSRWREEERMLAGGGLLINDSYNANPVSMAAALAHLAERSGGRRRVAVLGDMAELGPAGPAYHAEIGAAAAGAGVELLVALGSLARGYVEGAASVCESAWAPTVASGLPLIASLLQPGDCVLVKGSRSMGLEVVADALAPVGA